MLHSYNRCRRRSNLTSAGAAWPSFSTMLDQLIHDHYWKTYLDLAEDELGEATTDEVATEAVHLAQQQYDLSTAELQHADECWRDIALSNDLADPASVDQLGVYWSLDEESALSYSGLYHEGTRPVRFHARVDLAHVDLAATLLANLRYPLEHEIQFYPNAPIFVLDAEDDGESVALEVWRRC